MDHAIVHEMSQRFAELPAYVKQAADAQTPTPANLPSTAFADSRRAYPIHTKAACWMSNARYWADALFSEPDVELGRRLVKAANAWGIADDVRRLMTKISAEHEKYTAEIPDSHFALAVEHPTAGRIRQFPILDAASTQKSAQAFCALRCRLPYRMRKQAAEALLKSAARFAVPVPDEVRRSAAAYPVTFGAQVKRAAFDRATRAHNTPMDHLEPTLIKLAHGLADQEAVPAETAVKIAELLDTLDANLRLNRDYSTGHVALPEDLLFAGTPQQKRASVRLVTGTEIPLHVLETQGARVMQDLPEYAGLFEAPGRLNMKEAEAVLPTLPLDDARILEQLLKTDGTKTQPVV